MSQRLGEVRSRGCLAVAVAPVQHDHWSTRRGAPWPGAAPGAQMVPNARGQESGVVGRIGARCANPPLGALQGRVEVAKVPLRPGGTTDWCCTDWLDD